MITMLCRTSVTSLTSTRHNVCWLFVFAKKYEQSHPDKLRSSIASQAHSYCLLNAKSQLICMFVRVYACVCVWLVVVRNNTLRVQSPLLAGKVFV